MLRILVVLVLVPAAFVSSCTKPADASLSSRIQKAEGEFAGQLWVHTGGQDRKIADQAVKFWMIEGSREIVYSGKDGAGGYENEGQSLWWYAPGQEPRKLLSEKYEIEDVREVPTAKKKGLLVVMRDGGLGAAHVAVVDSARGEVFRQSQARFLGRDGDLIRLGFQREDDWEKLLSGQKVAPYREESYDLNQLLDRALIEQK